MKRSRNSFDFIQYRKKMITHVIEFLLLNGTWILRQIWFVNELQARTGSIVNLRNAEILAQPNWLF